MLKRLKLLTPDFLRVIINRCVIRIRHIGRGCKISYTCKISASSKLEGMNRIYAHTEFQGRLGYGSYIGRNSSLSADIGRFTSIAPFVRCNPGRHPYSLPFVTTSPSFFSLNKSNSQNGSTFATKQMFKEWTYYDEERKISVKIGNDCWIGENVFFVGGITIGDGAVVLAHAVVTKDVPAYAIVGGVPAKIIKYRYDDDTIAFLQEVQWWNFSVEWLKEHWELLCDMEKFKLYYNNTKA